MVMPGVGEEPGGPSRAFDEAGSNCSRSLKESRSAGQEGGGEKMRKKERRQRGLTVHPVGVNVYKSKWRR